MTRVNRTGTMGTARMVGHADVSDARSIALKVIMREGYKLDASYSATGDRTPLSQRSDVYVCAFAGRCPSVTADERAVFAAVLGAPVTITAPRNTDAAPVDREHDARQRAAAASRDAWREPSHEDVDEPAPSTTPTGSDPENAARERAAAASRAAWQTPSTPLTEEE